MKYIAYGSNMVQEQMAYRCPNARLIGMGWLLNHRLEFYLHATVERSRAKDARVPVAVWEIDKADEASLDVYEGVRGSYYSKHARTVHMNDGSEIKGMIYLMDLIRPYPPQQSYYDGIEKAYRQLGFEEEVHTILEPALDRAWKREHKR